MYLIGTVTQILAKSLTPNVRSRWNVADSRKEIAAKSQFNNSIKNSNNHRLSMEHYIGSIETENEYPTDSRSILNDLSASYTNNFIVG